MKSKVKLLNIGNRMAEEHWSQRFNKRFQHISTCCAACSFSTGPLQNRKFRMQPGWEWSRNPKSICEATHGFSLTQEQEQHVSDSCMEHTVDTLVIHGWCGHLLTWKLPLAFMKHPSTVQTMHPTVKLLPSFHGNCVNVVLRIKSPLRINAVYICIFSFTCQSTWF